jgi:hypothetical protein
MEVIMNKVIFLLAFVLISSSVFAEKNEKNDYGAGFVEGSYYMMYKSYEEHIKNDYEVLNKIDKLKGTEIEKVKDQLIDRLNKNLYMIGWTVKDIEGGAISDHFFEYMKKEEKRENEAIDKIYGSGHSAEMIKKIKAEIISFWKKLKDDREKNNWKVKNKDDKERNAIEKIINLAFDALIENGGIIQIDK